MVLSEELFGNLLVTIPCKSCTRYREGNVPVSPVLVHYGNIRFVSFWSENCVDLYLLELSRLLTVRGGRQA